MKSNITNLLWTSAAIFSAFYYNCTSGTLDKKSFEFCSKFVQLTIMVSSKAIEQTMDTYSTAVYSFYMKNTTETATTAGKWEQWHDLTYCCSLQSYQFLYQNINCSKDFKFIAKCQCFQVRGSEKTASLLKTNNKQISYWILAIFRKAGKQVLIMVLTF